MTAGLHHVTRALHLVVACLALMVVVSPASPGAMRVDPIAWTASPEGTGNVARARERVARPSRPARVARRAPTLADERREPARRAPAGVPSVVVRSRLYLRHEALLS